MLRILMGGLQIQLRAQCLKLSSHQTDRVLSETVRMHKSELSFFIATLVLSADKVCSIQIALGVLDGNPSEKQRATRITRYRNPTVPFINLAFLFDHVHFQGEGTLFTSPIWAISTKVF